MRSVLLASLLLLAACESTNVEKAGEKTVENWCKQQENCDTQAKKDGPTNTLPEQHRYEWRRR